MSALEVDSAVLGVGPNGESSSGDLSSRKQDCVTKTPHSWFRNTEENLNLARHWLTDSARLRKAVQHAIYNSRMAEHDQARNLNHSMMSKLNHTSKLRDDLERQLARVSAQWVGVWSRIVVGDGVDWGGR